jgi:hypothetical protein
MSSTRKIDTRQWPVVALADIVIGDMGNTVTIGLPPGALLRELTAQTITAFNSVTTAVMSVSDGTTTFINGVDLKSTGAETVSNLQTYYPSGGTLTITPTQTGGDATAGETIVSAEYVVVGRANESFG